MINTQTQIDSLIDLAVIQRTELKQLVESLPQLRDHLSSEIERNLEEIEPAIRSELEQFVAARALDTQAKTSAELGAKLDAMARNLESTTAAKYSVLMAERAQNATLLAQAEARIAEAASALPGAVKGIVTDELARFPRAGEIDQLRKEFAEPRGLNPRGRWQVGETYNKLDLVSYNGDSYVSNTDGNREKPSRSSEAWTLSAARGNGGGGGGATSLTDLVPVPANGELLIGNGSAFVNNTLTAGTGVTITNGPGSITIDASGAQELLTATVTNAESVAITKGQVVYLFGAVGNRASVKLADNSSDATSSKTFGVVSDASIAANGVGLITCVGVVDGLSLGAYSAGDVLYLGNTPGSVTVTKPYAPNHLVYVGMVERANNGNGELYVRIQNGYELDEIHDVQITSAPLAGSLLMRDATNSLWKANRLTGTANQVTVTNADTAVTLSLPTAIANVNSVTAQSATNLTLAGGSTGASLVLGQGASGNATLNVTNLATIVPSGIYGYLSVRSNNTANYSVLNVGSDPGNGYSFFDSSKVGTGTARDFIWSFDGTRVATLKTTGNLLIGTTTDISGTGGLKVAGTSTASSTTSGALQVGSNVGLSGNAGGASYFGGSVNGASTIISGYHSSTAPSSLGAFNAGIPTSLSKEILVAGDASRRVSISAYQDASPYANWGFLIQGTELVRMSANTSSVVSSGAMQVFGTTSASSSTTGAFLVGNGTPSTNVAIGGGNVNAGGTGTFGGAVTVTNTGSGGLVVNNTIGNPLATFNASNADAGATNNAYIILQTASTARWYLGQSISAADGAFEIYGAAQAAASLKIAKTTGNVSIASSTASTGVGTGALQVAGGIYAGGASVFGGGVTVATNLSVGAASGVLSLGADARASDTFLDINTAAANSRLLRFQTAGVARWQMGASSTAESGSNTGSNWVLNAYSDAGALLSAPLSIVRSTGAATFAGAVAIGNTVNTVSPTSPNRTVTMVIGGVTYYLAAKTTND